MNEAFFLASGFALLFHLTEESTQKGPGSFLQKGTWPFLGLSPLRVFRQHFELFLGLVFLLSLYGLAVELWLPAPWAARVRIPIFLALSYFFGRLAKSSGVFFLALFIFSDRMAVQGHALQPLLSFFQAAAAASATAFFRLLVQGLRHRLLVSAVPKPFLGLPILFLTAGILALMLTGFQKLIR